MSNQYDQIIWTGNEYELADPGNSEVPADWPVQDAGAHWHDQEFDGQRVVFRGSNVHFGFLAEELPESEVQHDADGSINLNDLYLCNNGRVYRAV